MAEIWTSVSPFFALSSNSSTASAPSSLSVKVRIAEVSRRCAALLKRFVLPPPPQQRPAQRTVFSDAPQGLDGVRRERGHFNHIAFRGPAQPGFRSDVTLLLNRRRNHSVTLTGNPCFVHRYTSLLIKVRQFKIYNTQTLLTRRGFWSVD